jgi:D-sedoheptulose 7-phosphate isomerase
MNNFKVQLNSIASNLDLLHTSTEVPIQEAIALLVHSLKGRLPVLVCGNGGSAADAQHIAGEMVGKFLAERKALNVRALSTDTSVITAWANDVSYDTVFARQVEAYAQPGGVLWAISTSGNSKNVLEAAKQARLEGMKVIGLTGEGGGAMATLCDIVIAVPAKHTPRIQEMHLMVYHYICEAVERNFV